MYAPNLMLLILACKWVVSPLLVVGGAVLCRFAWLKRNDARPFRIRDLCTAQSIDDSAKQQLLIEGVFGIALGILVFVVL